MRLLSECSVTSGVFCWILHLLLDVYAEERTAKQTGWIPSTIFANSSLAGYLVQNVSAATTKIKSPIGRAFHDNRIDSIGFDDHEYDHGDVPFISGDSSGSSYFPAHYKPGLVSSYTSGSSGSSSLDPYPPSGYPYAGSSYLPPSPPPYLPPLQSYLSPPTSSSQYQPSQQFDNSNSFLYDHDQPQNTSNSSESNIKKHLYVQPGQCSNSIQVQRIRDIEVQTSLTYGTAIRQGVCVLMLYAANEYNKLAISMQFANSSTGVIPSDTWLETNMKVYAVQTGAITFINTTSYFGTNSSSLILTKSNIVVLSFYIDGLIDFFLNIATYQSANC